jgi:hypothetical protein
LNTSTTEAGSGRNALLGLLLLPLLLALPCWLGLAWAEGDLVRQFYPWKELGRQAFEQGRLPLWNPFIYCGMPLLGNFQSALAYPLHLPFYFFPFAPALGWHLFIHFFISGWGLYSLAKALGLRPGPAFLAAICWQANAFLIARVEFMSALSAYAWTPWILYGVASNAGLRALSLWIGLQALAGYPLELGYTFVASFLLAFGLGKGSPGRLFLGWALGLGIAALALLPGLELTLHSSRLAGQAETWMRDTLSWRSALLWLWPLAKLSWMSLFSLSLPALVLAGFARGRAAAWALGMSLLGLALSLGLGAQLIPNRHPTLALVYCALGLALLCGMGAQALGSRLRPAYIAALGALILAHGAWQWGTRASLVGAELYQPRESAAALAAKMRPGARLLLAPEVQLERENMGASTTGAWLPFSTWLQADSAAPSGLRDANGYDPLAPAESVKLLNLASFPKFASDPWPLDLLGVETLGSWDARAGRFHVAFRKREAAPLRAMLVPAADEELLGLDHDAASLKPASQSKLRRLARRWKVGVSEESPESLSLDLPAGHPGGWVFLNDSYYPGWRAESDGEPAEIHRALGAFRAAYAPEGARHLSMRYKPLSFYVGLILSALVLFLVLFIL